MQPIEIADILSTELQLAHTGYLTHALCLEGTATLLFNGAASTIVAGNPAKIIKTIPPKD